MTGIANVQVVDVQAWLLYISNIPLALDISVINRCEKLIYFFRVQ